MSNYLYRLARLAIQRRRLVLQWSATASDMKDCNLNAVQQAMKPVRSHGAQVAYNCGVYQGSRQSVSDLPELIGLIPAFIVLMVVFGAPLAPTWPTRSLPPVAQGSCTSRRW